MANPFRSRPGSKKLNDPAVQCPLNKSEIRVEVHGFDPRNPGSLNPVAGVGLTVTGPSRTRPSTTPDNGTWRYQPLTPGTYTVTPDFGAALSARYDTTNVAPINKTLVAGQTSAVIYRVPEHWVEFVLQDTSAATLALEGVPWILEHQPPAGGAFARYDEGISDATGTVLRKPVPVGNHRLTVRTLQNPAWSAAEAVVGTSVSLSADATGFSAGEKGSFEILAACDRKTVHHTVPATVRAAGGGLALAADWTPDAGAFTDLPLSEIVFRATAGGAAVVSAPVVLKRRETINLADSAGKAVNRQVTLQFSDGHSQTLTTSRGKVECLVPIACHLAALTFPGLAAGRARVDAGGFKGAVIV